MDKHDIAELVKQRDRIQQLVDCYSERLEEIADKCQSNGLVPDEVRETSFYKFHKQQYDKHFEALRNFNGRLTNAQKRAMSKHKRGW